MHKLLLSLLVLVSFSASAVQDPPLAPEQCASQALYGFPTSKKQDTALICRKGYVLEHDNKAKIPIWVAYTLTPAHATGCFTRTNSFAPDLSLPPGAASKPKDYAKSGYDMGHMANNSDMRWDRQVEIESSIMSDITPQLPDFNRGIWKKLEDRTRAWAITRQHVLQIYAGPVYSEQDRTIGRGMVRVPHAFWKIIIDTQTGDVMFYKFGHEGSELALDTFLSSLAEIQRDTGLILPMPTQRTFSSVGWASTFKTATKTKKSICTVP